MTTWREAEQPPATRIGAVGWCLVLLRGPALFLTTYGGLLVLLMTRLAERPLCGLDRPVTPHITRFVCRAAFVILGMRYRTIGRPMRHKGAVVANHASWLDIFSLNASQQIYFVSKSEVAKWPGISWLARATGTVFINRDRSESKSQQAIFEERIRAGHKLLFFPEGTSTDGQRVLPFKSTLFAAFFTHGLEHVMQIQPVTVRYTAPEGQDPRFYAWWGDMDFGPHILTVLAQPRQGRVDVIFHPPVSVEDFPSRKELARYCEDAVRRGLHLHPPAPADET